jgi:hypothetical protein
VKLHVRRVTLFHSNVEDHVVTGAAGGLDARHQNVIDFIDAVLRVFTGRQNVARSDAERFFNFLDWNFARAVNLNRANTRSQIRSSAGKRQGCDKKKGPQVSHSFSMRRGPASFGFRLCLLVGEIAHERQPDLFVVERFIHHVQEKDENGDPEQREDGSEDQPETVENGKQKREADT